MTIRSLLGRAVLIAAALGSQGLYCQSGADCSAACDFVKNCPNLNKTFLLSCSRLGPSCLDNQIGDCASCIDEDSTTCAALEAGKCDAICVPNFDGGTLPVDDGGTPDAGTPDGGTDAGP